MTIDLPTLQLDKTGHRRFPNAAAEAAEAAEATEAAAPANEYSLVGGSFYNLCYSSPFSLSLLGCSFYQQVVSLSASSKSFRSTSIMKAMETPTAVLFTGVVSVRLSSTLIAFTQ